MCLRGIRWFFRESFIRRCDLGCVDMSSGDFVEIGSRVERRDIVWYWFDVFGAVI